MVTATVPRRPADMMPARYPHADPTIVGRSLAIGPTPREERYDLNDATPRCPSLVGEPAT